MFSFQRSKKSEPFSAATLRLVPREFLFVSINDAAHLGFVVHENVYGDIRKASAVDIVGKLTAMRQFLINHGIKLNLS